MSPFPVESSQRRVTSCLGLGCSLTLDVDALSQPGLKGGSVVPLRGVLRSLCWRLWCRAASRRVAFPQVAAGGCLLCSPNLLLCRRCACTFALRNIHPPKLYVPVTYRRVTCTFLPLDT
jgi:hypothetical protein